MKPVESYAALVGRILLAFIFVFGGIGKVGNWSTYKGMMAAKGIPWVSAALAVTIIIEIVGGLSLFAGYKARFWSFIMFLYLIPVSLVMHNFWAYAGMERTDQMVHFLKNLSIMGGLLMVTAFGAGRLSLDGRRAQPM